MFNYDTQGGRSYLVYCLEESDKLSNVTLNMMKNNSFHYLADISFYQIDEKSYARYDVTSKVPAKDLFGHEVNKKILLSYMQSIVKAVQEADDHMLDARCLCLEKERIYVDVDDGKAVVICLPLDKEEEPQPDFQRYFKDLMYGSTFNMNEDSSYVIRINNYLNSPAFSLDDFEKLLEELQDKKAPAASPYAGGAQEMAGGGSRPPVSPPPVLPFQNPGPQGGRPNQPPVSPGPAPSYGAQPMSRPPVYPVQTLPAAQRRPGPAGPQGPAAPVEQPDSNEPKMGLMYLLQNYSKENAAIYKEQKAKAKAAAATVPPAQRKEKPQKKEKPEKKKKSKEKAPVNGIAIPGQGGVSVPQPGARPGAPGGVPQAQAQAGYRTPPARPGQPGPQAPGPYAYPNPQAGSAPVRPQGPVPVQQPGAYPARPQGPVPVQQPGAYPARPAGQYASAPAMPGTVILDAAENDGTVILENQPTREPKGILMHKKTRMQVVIDKDEFRLGRNPNYADYTVSGGGAVSSAHAKILRRNGEFFVVDTNSSNHTYINGTMIPSMVEQPLKAGDKLRLANEEFEFTLQ